VATHQTHNTNAWLAPLLAGIVGAGLALLFAPRSGKETREKIQEQAKDLQQQVEEGMKSARESLSHSIQEAQDLKDRITIALSDSREQSRKREEELERSNAMTPASQSPVLSTWEEEV
jgi:gas vesicle protein